MSEERRRPSDSRGPGAPRAPRTGGTQGGFRSGPPREGGFRPRSDSARPPREGGFRPRPEGNYRPRPASDGGPPREGGYRPRPEGGAPRSGGFRPRPEGGGFRPRPEGGAPRSGGFRPRPAGDGGPPREGGYRSGPPREGGFRPRPEGGAPREGGFRSGPPREGGFRPRPEGGATREGGFRSGPPREGGFRPRPEGGAPREGGFRSGPPREGGFRPRPEGGGFRPRPEGDRGYRPRPESGAPRTGGFRPRPEGDRGGYVPRDRGYRSRDDRRADQAAPQRDSDSQEGAINRSRPLYADATNAARVRWRRDGKPSPATQPPWVAEKRAIRDAENTARVVASEEKGGALPSDPREAALRILHAVDTRSAFSDRLLDSAHAQGGPDPRDHALLHELVKGTLRWRGRIDHALDARIHIGLASVQPWIRNILRLGAYQILMLDRIPAHAAVDESVKLAHKYGHPGAAGLVNSVLRRITEEKDTITWPEGDDAAAIATWGSHPQWIVERWLARFGPEETRKLLMADNRPVPTGLRVNTVRGTRDDLIARLKEEGVEARPGTLSPDLVWVEGHHSPGALKAFQDGWCTAQDESESLVGRVVAPQKQERILDLCAAPGGKSTHLAELMGDDGEVWAMERDGHRVNSLQNTIDRLQLDSIHVVHGDGRSYVFPMPFDRALVDAPCSGLGVLGRRADARWRKGPEVLEEMPPVQLELLSSAARRLRPGGVLVYSVCTFEPEETDQIIEKFLAEHDDFKVESVAGSVPDALVTPEGYMRVLPQRDGCDGAFAARLRRA